MSAKTLKSWRESRDLHNKIEAVLMDVVDELNESLKKRELEMTTLPRGPRTSLPRFNHWPQAMMGDD